MKRVLSAALLGCATSTASASLIVTEPFAYSPGDSLVGKSPEAGFTWGSAAPAAADDAAFTSPGLSPSGSYTLPDGYPDPSGNKVTTGGSGRTYILPIGTQSAGTSVFYSMLVNVHSLHGTDFTPAIMTGVGGASDGGSNPTGITATLFGRHGTTAGTYQLGVARNSNHANAGFGSDIPLGNVVFVVAAVDLVSGTSNDVARLWINPDPNTFGADTPPTATVEGLNTGSDVSTINHFILYQRGTNNGLAVLGQYTDELRVGTSWADVTPIPEPASLGLLALGGAAVVLPRRRRRAE